jgi:hypothetical protein
MTTNDEGPASPFALAELVVVLLFYGAVAGAFWTGVIVGASALTDAGYGGLALVLLGIWSIVGAPVLYVQVGTMLDVIGRTLIGHTGIVPGVVALPGPSSIPKWIRLLGAVISMTAPTASLSALALDVLLAPSRPFALLGLKTRLETKAMATAVDRLKKSVSR